MRPLASALVVLALALVAGVEAAPHRAQKRALQPNELKQTIASIVEQRLAENELYERLHRTEDQGGHAAARGELAGHVTDAVTSLLQVDGDENAFSDSAGLAEPSPDCRRKLNTWMTDCVFGEPSA